MKTFIFHHKNSGVVLTLSASSLEEAERILRETVKDTYGWRVEDYDEDDE